MQIFNIKFLGLGKSLLQQASVKYEEHKIMLENSKASKLTAETSIAYYEASLKQLKGIIDRESKEAEKLQQSKLESQS